MAEIRISPNDVKKVILILSKPIPIMPNTFIYRVQNWKMK